MRLDKRGVALLEVVLALSILAVSSVAVTGLVVQVADAARRGVAIEREIREASAFLDAVVLWSREELNQRIGTREQGPWLLRIGKDPAGLFEIQLMTRDSVSLLETAVFRGGAP